MTRSTPISQIAPPPASAPQRFIEFEDKDETVRSVIQDLNKDVPAAAEGFDGDESPDADLVNEDAVDIDDEEIEEDLDEEEDADDEEDDAGAYDDGYDGDEEGFVAEEDEGSQSLTSAIPSVVAVFIACLLGLALPVERFVGTYLFAIDRVPLLGLLLKAMFLSVCVLLVTSVFPASRQK